MGKYLDIAKEAIYDDYEFDDDNRNLHLAMHNLRKFFRYDYEKLRKWMGARNPLLGGMTPIDMIITGKESRLAGIINDTLDENKPID